jgi:hypothetical protein
VLRSTCFLLALAACGGASSAPTTPSGPDTTDTGPDSDGGAPVYARLFEQGRTWMFDATYATSWYDPSDPAADASGNVRSSKTGRFGCTVAEVKQVAELGMAIAHVACTEPPGVPAIGNATGGYFARTSAGLWRLDQPPGETVELADEEMFLPAVAAPRQRSFEDPDGSWGWSRSVEQRADGAWCATASSWSGDDGGVTMCFRADVGLVGGAAFFGGGMSSDLTYEAAT